MDNQTRTHLLRRIVIGAIILMVLGFGMYIYTHGFATVKDYRNGSITTYTSVDDSLDSTVESSNKKDILLSSGLYSVSSQTSDGGQFISHLKVPHLLQSAPISQSTTPIYVETMARNSFASAFMNAGELASFEGSGTIRPANNKNITNDNLGDKKDGIFPEFSDYKQINKSIICGTENVGDGIQPLCYDTSSKKVSYYPVLNTNQGEITVGKDFGIFSTYNTQSNVVTIYRNNEKSNDIRVVNLSKDASVSENDGVPIYSASTKLISIVTGGDFISSNDNETDIPDQDQTITVLDPDTKKQISKHTFSEARVTDVSLSETGEYIAVTSLNQTAIYPTNGFAVPTFVIPFPVNDIAWQNDRNFVFTTLTDGLFSGSVGTKTASTIVPYDTVRPTELSFIDGDSVYFTGYAEVIKGNSKANIYRAQLNSPATGGSVNALEKFPYQGSGYYVDILGGEVTIQTTRYINDGDSTFDIGAKSAALEYIKKVLGNIDSYSINYTYVDLVIDTDDGEPSDE